VFLSYALFCSQGKEVAFILESNGVVHFPDPFTDGFGWDEQGEPLISAYKNPTDCTGTEFRYRDGCIARTSDTSKGRPGPGKQA
jgi:hypothetical protein